MTKHIAIIMVFLAALAFFIPFSADIPITDPVESNYALTAKEMVLSGDWLSPRIYGHYWFDKPVMTYWLIAASYKVFGFSEFAARFPAMLFSAASVAFAYWFSRIIFNNRQAALYSTLVLATSLEFWVLSRMIITDAVLFFYTSVSLATFYLGMQDKKAIWYVLAYATAGLAVLTKGPVGIILPGIIVFVYIICTRQWRLLSKLFIIRGGAIFLLVAAPWYVLMYQVHGQEFIDTFLGLHNYLRATVSEHPKDNVFYYYLVLFPISLLPWTGIFFKAVFSVIKREKSSVQTFLVAWILTMVAFYTMMATKYPTYVFPATFPAALLIGQYLRQMQEQQNRKFWWWLSLPTIILLIIAGGAPQLISMAIGKNLLLSSAIFLGLIIAWLQIKGNTDRLPVTTALTAIIISLLLIHNGLVPLTQSRSAKAVVQPLPQEGAAVASYGEYATSAVFYSGYLIPQLSSKPDNYGQGVWSGKYTMPLETVEEFDQRTLHHPSTYILVKADDQNPFRAEPRFQNFVPVIQYDNMTLYQRVLTP
jgi:4-amino-4-deoxy-L-arabinose transferase-like glycosyltransferase